MLVKFHPLGLIDYKQCWDFQEELFQELVKEKNANNPDRMNHLIFCEHPHVYTLGKSGDQNNLLINALELKAKNAQFYKTDRGGDITYHGPGQLVGYPIFDLDLFSLGLKDYIHLLEETIIQSLSEIGINGTRLPGSTGVWLDIGKSGKTRKICAIGVRSSHWITMHGFALNINTDLNYFGYINPCGFTDKSVTSIEKELGEKQDFNAISVIVAKTFRKMFKFE
jgi:lipoyl(octanoyl) transferase